MGPGGMGWWYWFGMQLFGITSIVLTWWLFLDAFKRKGTPSRFIWPVIAFAGLLMQTPAFAVSRDAQETGTGTAAALIGVVGLIVVTLASITHFYKSPASGGSGWSLRTRDENSSSRSTADRRHGRAPQASVPVAHIEARRSGRTAPPNVPTPPGASVRNASSAGTSSAPTAPVPAPAVTTGAAASAPSVSGALADVAPVAPGRAVASATDTTAAATVTEDAVDATIVEEPAPTLVDDADRTETDEKTLCDDVAATIVDEPATIDDEPSPTVTEDGAEMAPRLVITDGRSSRIIITERSGPFVVGRDPGKCSLAVEDSRASRAHFSITEHDGRYFIQDLGSSNGTFVNGALVHEMQPLNAGDTVEFGRTVATFEMAE